MSVAAITNPKAPPAKTSSLKASFKADETTPLSHSHENHRLKDIATAQETRSTFRPNFVVPAVVIATTTAGLAAAENRNQATNGSANHPDSFSKTETPKTNRSEHSAKAVATDETPVPSSKQRLIHAATAALAIGSVLMLRRAPRAESKLHGSLISTDWKEWAKVGLGITGLSQVNAALNWKPPLWLQSMTNVLIVGPLASGFTKKNVMQAAMLAPVVSGMAQTTQYLSEKSEDPFQKNMHISPVVTHALFSVGMMMAALRVFPWVSSVMPVAAGEGSSASARSGMISTCTNGCCSSLVCVNDMSQLGASLVNSIRKDSKAEEKAEEKAEGKQANHKRPQPTHNTRNKTDEKPLRPTRNSSGQNLKQGSSQRSSVPNS